MNATAPKVLLVDIETGILQQLQELLNDTEFGCNPVSIRSCNVTELATGIGDDDVVLVGGSKGALETLTSTRLAGMHFPIIVLGSGDDRELASATIAAGADDVLGPSELTPRLLNRAVINAVQRSGYDAAMREIRRCHDRFELLIRRGLDIITVVDSDGTISFASPSIQTILGYTVEGLIGRNIIELIHPDDILIVVGVVADSLITPGNFRRITMRFLHADGSVRWLESVGANLNDDPSIGGYVINARDVTERIRLEAERSLLLELVQAEREQLANLVSGVSGVMWEKRGGDSPATRRLTFVSAGTVSLLGYSSDQMIDFDRDGTSLLHPDDREEIGRQIDMETLPGEFHRRYRMMRKDGEIVWIESHVVATRAEDGGMIERGLSLDITSRVHAELALKEANEQLEIRVEERTAEIVTVMKRHEEITVTLKRFIADASHDLRTPLTILRAELDLLLRQELDPGIHPVIRRLNTQTDRLDNLFSDLLTLATLDTDDSMTDFGVARLDELMLDCASQLRVVAQARRIVWNVDCSEPIEFNCRHQSIRRMMCNLMDNAIKYSHTGGTISLKLHEVPSLPCISGAPKNQRTIEFVIRDSGAGIDARDLPYVFDRFYRGDLTRSTPGTGLGLAIVKAVADAHGGTVTIDSAAGTGTTVTVRFPIL